MILTSQILFDTLSHLGGVLVDHAALAASALIVTAGVLQVFGNAEARRLSEQLAPTGSRRRAATRVAGRALRAPLSLVRARSVVRSEDGRWGRDRRPAPATFNGGHF